MNKFTELGVKPEIIQILGYDTPTEIQTKTIPVTLEGKDIIAQSATGSGKTFSFGIGVENSVEKGKGVQALILTPTRELAQQVEKELHKICKHKKLHTVCVYGGVSINPQISGIRQSEVVIGTPGRVLDHIDRRTLPLNGIKILVLDEADRMLDMGFRDDVETIMKACSTHRQTLLFSATMSQDVMRLGSKYMKNPVKITAQFKVDTSLLRQYYYDTPENVKFSLLVTLLRKKSPGLTMVFCNTQRTTDFVAKNLSRNGIDAVAIHGGLTQNRRNEVLQQFHKKGLAVLVCTDVASRGLDIKDVSEVYNYDIPNDSKEYTHRIGRTARAGKSGIAINILTRNDYGNFQSITGKREHLIEKKQLPELEKVNVVVEHKKPQFSRGQRVFGNRDGQRSESRYGSGQSQGHGGFRGSNSRDRTSEKPSRGFRSRR